VYLGMTAEITVLEVLLHLNGVLSVPLVLSAYDVPAGPGLIAKPEPNAWPEGWNAIPHGQPSAAFGGDWLRTGQQLGLMLPSVVVPQARNLLLNPLHPAMTQVVLLAGAAGQLGQALRQQLPAGIGPTGCSMAAPTPPLIGPRANRSWTWR